MKRLFRKRKREVILKEPKRLKNDLRFFYLHAITVRTGGLLAAGLIAATSVAGAADWPQYRGNPAQTGVASGKLSAAPKLLWKFKTARPVTGTAAIVGGH